MGLHNLRYRDRARGPRGGRRVAQASAALRRQRLAMLAELAGRLERGDFSERELIENEAALRMAPLAAQRALPFPGGRDAARHR